MRIITIIVVITVVKCVSCQYYVNVKNPCPSVLQYYQNNGEYYGYLKFSNDNSGYYKLSVNMSLAADIEEDQNINIELQTSADDLANGSPVIYVIRFPIQGILPIPTKIEFNNRVYCTGPPEKVIPGGGVVTNMWASTSASTSTRPQSGFFFHFGSPPGQNPFTLPTLPTFYPSRPRPPNGPEISVGSPSLRQSPSYNEIPVTPATTSTTSYSTTRPVEQCGHSSVLTQTLIVNGVKTRKGEFPWLVAIMYRKNYDYRYRCTGSLVSRRHVITAGHCLQYYNAPVFTTEDVLLVMGKNNIQNWAREAMIRDAKNITVHPSYKESTGDYDIAVITLDRDVEVSDNVRPVCLWQEDDNLDRVVGQQGTVVGFGKDETGTEFVPDARSVQFPIVSQAECLRSDGRFAGITSVRTFCAGNRDGTGPCTGDSGAGFFMNRNGRWTLRGVVSRAVGELGTCDPLQYFVFMDAAKVRDWLRSAMM